MVENPSSYSSSSSSSASSSSSSSSSSIDQRSERKKKKETTRSRINQGEESGELIECSGEYCSSCTATIVADCIAVCCCPCAIANLVILTFVKVPWMMGRKCLGFMKKKRRMLGRKERKKRKLEKKKKKNIRDDEIVMERDGNLRKAKRVVMEDGNNNIFTANVDVDGDGDESSENFCASYEAERVWFEMYQLGHLGFGRVSFSGVPEKGN